MESSKKHKIIRTTAVVLGCVVVLAFIIIKLYNNRRIDSLDGFWVSRGAEHYVAYVHGDTIDMFYYEDREESELTNYGSLYWFCGHFTPPEPGFNRYDWELTWDYDRSHQPTTWWRAEDSAHIGADPLFWNGTIPMSYKDGKLIRHFVNSERVFYRTNREYPEILEKVAEMDAAAEMVDNGLPVEIISFQTFPESELAEDYQYLRNIIFAEINNPNPYRIREAGIAFYDEEIDLREAEVQDFGGFIWEDGKTVLVTTQIGRSNLDTNYKTLIFNEYAVYIPGDNLTVVEKPGYEVNTDGKGYAKSVDVTIHVDDTHSYVREDGTIGYYRPEMAVVFYLNGRIVGGGYCYFDLTDNDMTVNVPVMTDVTEYDDVEIYVY